MPTTKSSDVNIGDSILASQYNNLRDDAQTLVTAASAELTISSGAVSYVTGQAFYRIDTEGDAASDDLDTISNGDEGDVTILVAENTSRVVTVKDGTGNIELGSGDCDLDSDAACIMLVCDNAGNWRELGRSPKPAGLITANIIALADASCPANWTRFSALDDNFPRGAASYGGTGGAATHTHTYSTVVSHNHGVSALTCGSDGNHSHTFIAGGSGGGRGSRDRLHYGGLRTTNSAGAHTHDGTGTSASEGAASPESGSESSLPPYLDMVFCKKD